MPSTERDLCQTEGTVETIVVRYVAVSYFCVKLIEWKQQDQPGNIGSTFLFRWLQ